MLLQKCWKMIPLATHNTRIHRNAHYHATQVFQSYTKNFQAELLDSYWTLTGTATLGQSGSESNSNEGVTPQFSRVQKWELHHQMQFYVNILENNFFLIYSTLLICS